MPQSDPYKPSSKGRVCAVSSRVRFLKSSLVEPSKHFETLGLLLISFNETGVSLN